MRTRARSWSWLALALMLAVALASLAGCGASSVAGAGSGTARQTPTATVRPTAMTQATATVTTSYQPGPTFADPATLGWVKAGAPRPDVAATAPSSPGTLATCTGAAGQSTGGPITLSISTDDGGSWQTHDTGISLGRCMGLAISPASASSIALYAGTCRSDCGQGYERLYLSSDGGGHWRQVTPSADGVPAECSAGWAPRSSPIRRPMARRQPLRSSWP